MQRSRRSEVSQLLASDTTNGGLTRTFTRFSQAIDEVVDARVWSGIHFRNADEQGAKIGRQVARYREKHYFQPVEKHDRGNDDEGNRGDEGDD